MNQIKYCFEKFKKLFQTWDFLSNVINLAQKESLENLKINLNFVMKKEQRKTAKNERNESTKIHLCKSKNLFQNCILKFYEKFA